MLGAYSPERAARPSGVESVDGPTTHRHRGAGEALPRELLSLRQNETSLKQNVNQSID